MKKLAVFLLYFSISFSMFGQLQHYFDKPQYSKMNEWIKSWKKDPKILNPSTLENQYMSAVLNKSTYWFSAHNHIYILSFEPNKYCEQQNHGNSQRNLYLYRLVGDTTWVIACDKPILKAFWKYEGMTEGDHGSSVFSYLSYYGQTDIDVFTGGKVEKGYVKKDEKGNITIQLTLLRACLKIKLNC